VDLFILAYAEKDDDEKKIQYGRDQRENRDQLKNTIFQFQARHYLFILYVPKILPQSAPKYIRVIKDYSFLISLANLLMQLPYKFPSADGFTPLFCIE
jgi:hypothetical protein